MNTIRNFECPNEPEDEVFPLTGSTTARKSTSVSLTVELLKNKAVSFYDLLSSSVEASANKKFYGKQRNSSPYLTIKIKINIRLTSSITARATAV